MVAGLQLFLEFGEQPKPCPRVSHPPWIASAMSTLCKSRNGMTVVLLKSQTPTFDYKLELDYRGGGGKCHLGELHWH